MKRLVTRLLVFISIPVIIVGTLVLITQNSGATPSIQLHDEPLLFANIIGGILLSLGIITLLVGYIGAIIRTGQLQQWPWFGVLLGLLVFLWPIGIIALVIYCFIGPDSAATRAPVYIMYPPAPPPAPSAPPETSGDH